MRPRGCFRAAPAAAAPAAARAAEAAGGAAAGAAGTAASPEAGPVAEGGLPFGAAARGSKSRSTDGQVSELHGSGSAKPGDPLGGSPAAPFHALDPGMGSAIVGAPGVPAARAGAHADHPGMRHPCPLAQTRQSSRLPPPDPPACFRPPAHRPLPDRPPPHRQASSPQLAMAPLPPGSLRLACQPTNASRTPLRRNLLVGPTAPERSPSAATPVPSRSAPARPDGCPSPAANPLCSPAGLPPPICLFPTHVDTPLPGTWSTRGRLLDSWPSCLARRHRWPLGLRRPAEAQPPFEVELPAGLEGIVESCTSPYSMIVLTWEGPPAGRAAAAVWERPTRPDGCPPPLALHCDPPDLPMLAANGIWPVVSPNRDLLRSPGFSPRLVLWATGSPPDVALRPQAVPVPSLSPPPDSAPVSPARPPPPEASAPRASPLSPAPARPGARPSASLPPRPAAPSELPADLRPRLARHADGDGRAGHPHSGPRHGRSCPGRADLVPVHGGSLRTPAAAARRLRCALAATCARGRLACSLAGKRLRQERRAGAAAVARTRHGGPLRQVGLAAGDLRPGMGGRARAEFLRTGHGSARLQEPVVRGAGGQVTHAGGRRQAAMVVRGKQRHRLSTLPLPQPTSPSSPTLPLPLTS